VSYRNGYRPHRWASGVGTIDLTAQTAGRQLLSGLAPSGTRLPGRARSDLLRLVKEEDGVDLARGDFRRIRRYLAPHLFAWPDDDDDPGTYPPPSDLIPEESWDHVMILPTDVALIVHNTRSEAISAERDSGARPTIRTNRVHVASADARPAHLGGQAQSCRRSRGIQLDDAQRISGHNREPSVLCRVRASRWEWDLTSDRAWPPRLWIAHNPDVRLGVSHAPQRWRW